MRSVTHQKHTQACSKTIRSKLELTEHRHDDVYLVHLTYNGWKVGDANCVIYQNVMTLGDIHIRDDFVPPAGSVVEVLRRLVAKPKALQLRKQGLGTRMLQMVIAEAKRRGLHEITGSVTLEDRESNPKLLDWYCKHGFQVEGKDNKHPEWLRIVRSLS